MTWKAGIDVVTLGLTKTGAIGCEIILLFGDMCGRFDELKARAKRAGHMPPKMRYLAAQAQAMLRDNLWLDLARRANQSAKQLADLLCAHDGVRLAYATDGNEVFADIPPTLEQRIIAANVQCYPWPGGSYRFVCNWATPQNDLDAIRDLLA
jgi:threonine aldolase